MFLVVEYSAHVAGAAFCRAAAAYRDNGRKCRSDGLHLVVRYAAYLQSAILAGGDLLGVCHLWPAEPLGRLGAYVCRVAVDGLASGQYEVGLNLACRHCQRVGCGHGVGTGKAAVREEYSLVGSAVYAVTQHLLGSLRAHAYQYDSAARNTIL